MNRKLFLVMLFSVAMFMSCGRNSQDVPLQDVSEQKMCELAELGTVECMVSKIVTAESMNNFKNVFGERKICFSINATVKVGFDMSNFSDESVSVDKETKSITINLPKPKILHLNIDPDDIKVPYENVAWCRSDFTAKESNEILTKGENEIKEEIDSYGIMDEAQKNAKLFFTSLLQQAGYKTIKIRFKK